MRLAIFFTLIACGVFAFILLDHFPDLLQGAPALERLHWKTRDMLGLEVPDPTFLSDSEMADPEKIYREQASMEEVAGSCGLPPDNPWTRGIAPTEADIERYQLALRIWDYCRQRAEVGDSDSSSPYERKSAGSKLQDYPE